MKLFLITALLVLTGCTSTGSVTTQAPRSLAQVNDAVGRGQFRIVRPGYAAPLTADRMRMTQDRVEYRSRETGAWSSVATETVSRIEKRQRYGVGEGMLVGAVPGILLATGGLVSIAAEDCDDSEAYLCGLAGAIALGVGVPLAALGALVGAGLGSRYSDTYEVVYAGPVERYLTQTRSSVDRSERK